MRIILSIGLLNDNRDVCRFKHGDIVRTVINGNCQHFTEVLFIEINEDGYRFPFIAVPYQMKEPALGDMKPLDSSYPSLTTFRVLINLQQERSDKVDTINDHGR